MKKKSNVIALMEVVCRGECTGTGHSWQRINPGRRAALSLAIKAGFEFLPNDITFIMSEKSGYRSEYWVGESPEWIYTLAVVQSNLSAAVSYEKWKGREPFIADDVSGRDKDRLYVGAEFPWAGNPRVRIKSFADDGSYLNAGLYDENGHGRKLLKRFKISREDIVVDRASRKDRKLTMEELSSIANTADGGFEVIYKALGARTKKEFDALPLSKLQDVLRSFKPDARCLNKGKPRKRTPEIRWLEKFVKGKYCKEVVAFLKNHDSVAQAWDAAISSGESRSRIEAHRIISHLSDTYLDEKTTGIQAEEVVRKSM